MRGRGERQTGKGGREKGGGEKEGEKGVGPLCGTCVVLVTP